MSGASDPVAVSILGKEYRISCEPGAEQELIGAARFLDARMREARGSGKVIGTDRIAVMVALNLAHELPEGEIRSGFCRQLGQQAYPFIARAHRNSAQRQHPAGTLTRGFSLCSDILCGARQLARCSLEPMLMHNLDRVTVASVHVRLVAESLEAPFGPT